MADQAGKEEAQEVYSREFGIPDGATIRIGFEIVPASSPAEKQQGVTDCCLKAEIRRDPARPYRPWFKRVPFSWLRLEDFLALCRRIYTEVCRRLACRRK